MGWQSKPGPGDRSMFHEYTEARYRDRGEIGLHLASDRRGLSSRGSCRNVQPFDTSRPPMASGRLSFVSGQLSYPLIIITN